MIKKRKEIINFKKVLNLNFEFYFNKDEKSPNI